MENSAEIVPPKPVDKKPNPLAAWFRGVLENPIIIKELRGRMRGRRAFVILTSYLLIIALYIGGVYALLSLQSGNSFYNPSFRQTFGKVIFGNIVILEFLLVAFIGPALTAGAITSERERQTYDLLRTTLVSARALVFGKLGSAFMYLFLLIFTVLPVQAIAFWLGGVGIEELLVSGLMLVVNAIFFCALGLFFSSFMKRTLGATVAAYGSILVFLLMLGVVGFVGLNFSSYVFSNNNPMLEDTIVTMLWLMSATNSIASAVISEVMLVQEQSLFFMKQSLPGSGVQMVFISPWILHVALYALLSALMILLSIVFVRRPDRS